MCQRERLKKTHSAHARAIAAGEDEVVEYGKVKRLRRTRQLARRGTIRMAWPGNAARVIMGKDQAGASAARRVEDDLTDRYAHRFRLTIVGFDVKAAAGMVDMGHPQPLAGDFAAGETGGEKAAGGFMAVQQRGGFGTLEPHAEILWAGWPFA